MVAREPIHLDFIETGFPRGFEGGVGGVGGWRVCVAVGVGVGVCEWVCGGVFSFW